MGRKHNGHPVHIKRTKWALQKYLLLLGGLLSSLGDLTALLGFVYRLDNSHRDGLSHVSDGESTKRGVVGVGLNTERLLGNKLDNGGVTGLDELGGGLHDLTGSSVNLLD